MLRSEKKREEEKEKAMRLFFRNQMGMEDWRARDVPAWKKGRIRAWRQGLEIDGVALTLTLPSSRLGPLLFLLLPPQLSSSLADIPPLLSLSKYSRRRRRATQTLKPPSFNTPRLISRSSYATPAFSRFMLCRAMPATVHLSWSPLLPSKISNNSQFFRTSQGPLNLRH